MGTGLYRILKERTGKLNFMQMVKGRNTEMRGSTEGQIWSDQQGSEVLLQ